MILSSESKYPVHANAESSALLETLRVQEVSGQGFAGTIGSCRMARSQRCVAGPRVALDPPCCPLPRTAARSLAGNSRCRPFLLPHPDAKLQRPVVAASETSAPDRRTVQPRRSSSHAGRDSTHDLIVTHRSRRQLQVRFTTRVSKRKSGEEVLA